MGCLPLSLPCCRLPCRVVCYVLLDFLNHPSQILLHLFPSPTTSAYPRIHHRMAARKGSGREPNGSIIASPDKTGLKSPYVDRFEKLVNIMENNKTDCKDNKPEDKELGIAAEQQQELEQGAMEKWELVEARTIQLFCDVRICYGYSLCIVNSGNVGVFSFAFEYFKLTLVF